MSEEVKNQIEFPKEHIEKLEGLLFVGKLTDSLRVCGHTVDIKTLTMGELASVGEFVRSYIGSRGETIAHHTAVVAACIERVDGKKIYEPLSDSDDCLSGKFDVVKNWYPIVVDEIFEGYVSLESIVKEVADKLGES